MPGTRPTLHTHYDNLKVARDAPPEIIRAAYKVLAQRCHPDKWADAGEATQAMQILGESQAVLLDPQRRAEHDAWIAQQEQLHQAWAAIWSMPTVKPSSPAGDASSQTAPARPDAGSAPAAAPAPPDRTAPAAAEIPAPLPTASATLPGNGPAPQPPPAADLKGDCPPSIEPARPMVHAGGPAAPVPSAVLALAGVFLAPAAPDDAAPCDGAPARPEDVPAPASAPEILPEPAAALPAPAALTATAPAAPTVAPVNAAAPTMEPVAHSRISASPPPLHVWQPEALMASRPPPPPPQPAWRRRGFRPEAVLALLVGLIVLGSQWLGGRPEADAPAATPTPPLDVHDLTRPLPAPIQAAGYPQVAVAHPDARVIVASPGFAAWRQQQGRTRQAEIARILRQGSPGEVIALLHEYKRQLSDP